MRNSKSGGTALVVMPSYCEAETIETIIRRVLAVSPALHLLVVDDNSPDGTAALAEAIAREQPRVFVLNRPGKAGLGAAYSAGFAWALERGYEVIIEMDADGSHQPEQLPALLTAIDAGADLAIGTRWMPGGKVINWPLHRRAISRIGTLYARVLLGSKLRDITAGYRAYSRALLSELVTHEISSHGYSFQIEMAWKAEQAGAVIAEVPITFIEREHGRSKMSADIVFEAMSRVTQWSFTRWFKSR